jgi:hypothetical protein
MGRVWLERRPLQQFADRYFSYARNVLNGLAGVHHAQSYSNMSKMQQ